MGQSVIFGYLRLRFVQISKQNGKSNWTSIFDKFNKKKAQIKYATKQTDAVATFFLIDFSVLKLLSRRILIFFFIFTRMIY